MNLIYIWWDDKRCRAPLYSAWFQWTCGFGELGRVQWNLESASGSVICAVRGR